MASSTSKRYDSPQPGLEVVMEREGLELATDREGQYPEVQSPQKRYLETDRHAPPQSYSGSSYSRSKPAPLPLTYSENSRRQEQRGESCRRLWLVLAVIIAVLVVVGSIVGGVVGSREMKKSKGAASSSSTDSSATTSTSPTSPTTSNTVAAAAQSVIKPNSPLTATGWREGAFFHIHLFYQGPDGTVRRSRFSSEGNKGWSKPENFTSIKTLAAGSPLAATANIAKSPPEINLYYLNPQSQLSGHRFQDSSSTSSSASAPILSLQNSPTVLSPDSKLSAYHPVLAAQNFPSGSIQYFRDWSFEGRSWENFTLPSDPNSAALPSTPMVMLPTAVTYQDAAGFLYVNDKGQLSTYLASTNNTLVDGWSWGVGSTGVTLPSGRNKSTAMGAFVYGRTRNLVNTHVLFAGDDGKLREARQQDEAGWKGPATTDNEVLRGIEVDARGTEIACVTMALWELSEVRLKGQADMNRCFFQGGNGRVREVWFDGGRWVDVGDVPLF
ncbi:hypothetical protein QBC44DRAFT_367466 [Cladorrhinum sp. PSN332]|nr:hypothetical protein QBC44DRAFT_367466 [Cladorrhinum sp. PSN332]